MLIVVETPLPEDALSLARALRRAAQNLLKMSRIDARETTSHTHEPRKGKSRMWCECAVLCDRRARRFLRAVAATRADACLS